MSEKFLLRSEFQRFTKNLNRLFSNIQRSEYTRPIHFDNTMTTAAMQALIDACHKHIPAGYAPVFQFNSAGATTYTMIAALNWKGFYGGGRIIIQGNTGEANATALHTTQDVFLDFSGQECDGIIFEGNMIKDIIIQNLDIRVKSNGTDQNTCIHSHYSFNIEARYNHLRGNGTAKGRGYRGNAGTHWVHTNYVSYIKIGIGSEYSANLKSENNDDTATPPLYGLAADDATIHKKSTQPAGSTNYEITPNGGRIWGTLFRDNVNNDEEGLLIQTGINQFAKAGTTITFDIAYSVAPTVTVTAIGTGGWFAALSLAPVAASFTAYVERFDAGGSGPKYCCWHAIGKKVG